MSTISACHNFIRANLKRMVFYIPHVLLAVILLLALTGSACVLISSQLYKEDVFQTIRLGYYLPENDDTAFMDMGVSLVQDLEGMQETAELIQVSSPEEGYSLLEEGEILYLIIIPDQFFEGIMYGDNFPLDIVVRNNSSVTSYIANELFMSYAGCLGIAQAGIYSCIDMAYAHTLTDEERKLLINETNILFLERVLNKATYLAQESATNEGNYSLIEHYLALAVLLSLCFTAFLLMPLLQGTGNGIREGMRLYRLNTFHIWLGNMITTTLCLYIAFIPCWIGVSIYHKSFHPAGILTVLPAIIMIACLIATLATICKSAFSANMFLLFAVLIFAYVGGGLLPQAMLPKIIQQIGAHMPGHYALKIMAHALFA